MRNTDDEEQGFNRDEEEHLRPSLACSTMSLDLDILNTETFDKENMKECNKYSVMREKHLQKYIRYEEVLIG